jgi:hypothetical protein
MVNGNGAAADYHGAAGSGVAGPLNNSRAMDFSSNGANQPGSPGPLAVVTNASFGFGNLTNFAATFWFKQNALMANGANIGPRLFVLGDGAPSDTGAANSLGVKFQTAGQLYFQIGSATLSATFPTNLPANAWLFLAVVYDGANMALYQGTDTNASSLIASMAGGSSVNFGASGALFVGNRQDRQRSFDGWIDDFRLYTGVADATFVENIRLLAASPPASPTATPSDSLVSLRWNSAPGATGYNVQRSTKAGGPYTVLSAGTNVSATNFTDLTVTNGTVYYYVVSAVNPAGVGANSPEAFAVPVCTPPPSPLAGNNGPIFQGMTLNLTASTVTGATYYWTGPNGFNSTNQNPSIANATTNYSGLYSVTATVGNCVSAPATTTVTVNPPASLSLQMAVKGFALNWPGGALQSATNLAGPWSNVPGAAAPYTVSPTNPARFYRLKLQ